MKRSVLCFLLILALSFCLSAKTLEVWIVGWTNEMARIAEDLIAAEYTPKTGVEVDITLLAGAMAIKSPLLLSPTMRRISLPAAWNWASEVLLLT